MSIATRDAQRMPAVSQAVGCLVSGDRRRVTVLIDAAQSAGVAADIAAGSPVAVVFSLPATHCTVQIKGEGASAAGQAAPGCRAGLDGARPVQRAERWRCCGPGGVGAPLSTAGPPPCARYPGNTTTGPAALSPGGTYAGAGLPAGPRLRMNR